MLEHDTALRKEGNYESKKSDYNMSASQFHVSAVATLLPCCLSLVICNSASTLYHFPLL